MEKGRSVEEEVASAAGFMMAAILLSRLLGLAREMVIAYLFGMNKVTDCYIAAFTLPDLLYFLMAGGALSTAFIPVFTEYLAKGRREEAERLFRALGTGLALLASLVVLLGEILAPLIVPLIAPGFKPWQKGYTIHLTRIMLPAQFFFALGGLFSGTLYSLKHFIAPGLASSVYNLFIILGGVLLGHALGVEGLSWGVVTGAFVSNFLMQLLPLKRRGMPLRPASAPRHPGIWPVVRLMLPVMIGLAIAYMAVIVNRIFASYLFEGAITSLNYAFRLMMLPVGIFAMGTGIAILPFLSEEAAKEDLSGFRRLVSLGLRLALFTAIPSAAALILFRVPIIRVLFEHGRFGPEDTITTSFASLFYAPGILALSGQQILHRAFYARQNPYVPVAVGVSTLSLCALFNALLVKPLGHGGLALGNSLAHNLGVVILVLVLRAQIGGIEGREVGLSVAKTTLGTAIGAVFGAVACCAVFSLLQGGRRFIEALRVLAFSGWPTGNSAVMVDILSVLAGLLAFGVSFLAMAAALRMEELKVALDVAKRRLRGG